MKTIGAQVASFLRQRETRQNLRILLKLFAVLGVTIALFSIAFHFLMLYEDKEYSWFTGVYWTLVVMTTLGFGDITFHTDLGRVFSVVVLLTGVFWLLILLPFAFIRFFYGPWLEAQVKLRAPREAPPGLAGHVVLARWDAMAPSLVERLTFHRIPYLVIEGDPPSAARLQDDGIAVVAGEVDDARTYRAVRLEAARLLVANADDVVNTNITLIAKEVAPRVPVAAIVDFEDSIDILELSGADYVLPIKKWLGEQLAVRARAGHACTHVIGRFHDLRIAELPVHHTPFAGSTVRDTRLRERAGASIVAVWERGRLVPARPELLLTDLSVLVLAGTDEQLRTVDSMVEAYDVNPNPVVIIGGGKVGRSAARALKRRGVPVHMVEKQQWLRERIGEIPDQLLIGDAADRRVLERAGILQAPSVLVTTNVDATNIFLTAYCRRLNRELQIVSRITSPTSLEAIHRAGADIALSAARLAAGAIDSVLQGREPIVLGEGVDLILVPLPANLAGHTLAESGIGARTGMTVIAVRRGERLNTAPPPQLVLEPGSELVMIGSDEQRAQFAACFGDAGGAG
ncbi:MAG: potassium transporter TrkA [Planctomycetota bacterium]|nr:MAG: potassium transporter TrkA [Planctomycetota bacterium]